MKHWWSKSQTGWWVELGKCITIFSCFWAMLWLYHIERSSSCWLNKRAHRNKRKQFRKEFYWERERERIMGAKPIKWMIHKKGHRQIKGGEKSEHVSQSLNSKFNNVSLSIKHWPKTDVNVDINKNWFKEVNLYKKITNLDDKRAEKWSFLFEKSLANSPNMSRYLRSVKLTSIAWFK